MFPACFFKNLPEVVTHCALAMIKIAVVPKSAPLCHRVEFTATKKPVTQITGFFVSLNRTYKPYLSIKYTKAAMEARKRHQTLTLQKVQRRIEEERSGKRKGKRRDFMSYILGNDRENLSNMDLFGMASALIVAGSNTTT